MAHACAAVAAMAASEKSEAKQQKGQAQKVQSKRKWREAELEPHGTLRLIRVVKFGNAMTSKTLECSDAASLASRQWRW